MSTPHDDGGPAYPTTQPDPDTEGFMGLPVTKNMPGMSLRDWFAGSATEKDIEAHYSAYDEEGQWIKKLTREESKYAYASAMIAARKESQP